LRGGNTRLAYQETLKAWHEDGLGKAYQMDYLATKRVTPKKITLLDFPCS